MSNFQPPPTWALPILVDEKTQKAIFNPVWLKWFVDLTKVLNAAGGTTLGVHNNLSSIQGGSATERYHLTSAQQTSLTGGGTSTQHTHDHGALAGLADDDHTQYLLAAGTRALTGNWNAGAYSITAQEHLSTSTLGYTTGAGGTVTQITSKSTGVTLNKACGQITMNGAALASGATVGFTLTNSVIAATDVVLVNIASGATADSYQITVDAVAAGSCRFSIDRIGSGSLSEAIVLNFAVLKATAA